jgi:Uma2 family endonuclease
MDDETKQTEIMRYKFNVDQYFKMAEVGILPWGHGEELLDGVVWDRAPLVRNRSHPALKGGITRFLNEMEDLSEEVDACIHKYTVDEYHAMGEAGILTEDDRVELIDGEIVLMPPIGSPHQENVDTITELFVTRFSTMARVRVQGPVRLRDSGEPEPDLMLLRRREGSYRSRHPEPADVLLIVEVSDTTIRSDRRVKLPYYANNGIPETWLIDINGEAVEVYRGPTPEGYREVTRYQRGDTLNIQALPEIRLTVDELLG